jgi:hypothetical protein
MPNNLLRVDLEMASLPLVSDLLSVARISGSVAISLLAGVPGAMAAS